MFLSPPPPFPARPFLTFPNVLSPPGPVLVFFSQFRRGVRDRYSRLLPKSEMGRRALASCPDRPADRLYWGRGGRERERKTPSSFVVVVFFSRPPSPDVFPILSTAGFRGGGGDWWRGLLLPPFSSEGKEEKTALSAFIRSLAGFELFFQPRW